MQIADAWLRDLPQQFQDKHNIEVLISAFAKQMQEVETMFGDLNVLTDLENAAGRNLDHIGTIIPLTRKEAGELAGIGISEPVISDERYRQFLRYKDLANTNECTYYDLMESLELLWKIEGVKYHEDPQKPAAIYLILPKEDVSDSLVLPNERKFVVKPAGVRVIYELIYTSEIYMADYEHIKARADHHFFFPFYGMTYFDGRWILDGSHLLDPGWRDLQMAVTTGMGLDMSGYGAFGNGSVITRTSDFWFLDGTQKLDGTGKCNPIYQKEEIA